MDLVAHVGAFVARLSGAASRPIVVACSGGPDSVVLADVAMRLAAADALGPVTLAYIDHQLRADSAGDGVRVAELAAQGGAGFVSRAVTVAPAGSLEDAARRARYAALDAIAGELGAGWVLVGHTATDQAETVLMRLCRGTGVIGLAAIPAVRGRYARPLLDVPRAEVEAYRAGRGLAAVSDPMNADLRFARSRIRHQILPRLRESEPAIDDHLVQLARSAREAREVIEAAAAAVPADDAGALAAAPPAVAKCAVARAAEVAGLGPLAAAHLEAVLALCRRPPAGTVAIDLPGGRAIREYRSLRLEPTALDPGTAAGSPPPFPEPPPGHHVRLWQPGDRMRPTRLHGRSRKLSDLYVDAKIPQRLRRQARVLVRDADRAIVFAEHIGPAFGSRGDLSLTIPTTVATNKD